MVIRTFILFVRYVTVTNKNYHASLKMDYGVNLLCYILGKTAVNDEFYSKFKFRFSFLFRSLSEWKWLIS